MGPDTTACGADHQPRWVGDHPPLLPVHPGLGLFLACLLEQVITKFEQSSHEQSSHEQSSHEQSSHEQSSHEQVRILFALEWCETCSAVRRSLRSLPAAIGVFDPGTTTCRLRGEVPLNQVIMQPSPAGLWMGTFSQQWLLGWGLSFNGHPGTALLKHRPSTQLPSKITLVLNHLHSKHNKSS